MSYIARGHFEITLAPLRAMTVAYDSLTFFFGICPPSDCLAKHGVSKAGSDSVFRLGKHLILWTP